MATAGEEAQAPLEGGSYEVIHQRLLGQAAQLEAKADALNARRLELFGGQPLAVIGNERVRTENNCVPRNLVSVGKHLLLGFNVFIGLKKETRVADVFSLHRFEPTSEGFDVSTVPSSEANGFLDDPRFVKDFQELYRYHKDARLSLLRRTEARLLAVFQVGSALSDVKVLRFGIDPDGRITYVDNRGEADHQLPPSHDFEWRPATREQHVPGKHPHVNILDEVFIETIRGDLTLKVENNTEDGQGVYREPVEDPDQSLDDAQIHYAKVGVLILLKVLPFREEKWRYLAFNTRTRKVLRIDAIGQACVQLPEDQGIIFPGGYCLQTGEHKLYEDETAGLSFKRVVRSPNGEDVLYAFYEPKAGRYVLLPYNVVRKELASPIHCHGYCLMPDGKMVVFRSDSDEPTRVHPVQVWQTPFVSAEFAASRPQPSSYLGKIGNAELVRALSELYTLRRMAREEQPTRRSFEDLISQATRTLDAYHWLGHAEASVLAELEALRRTSELIVDEFEKVQTLQRRAVEEVGRAASSLEELLTSLGTSTPDSVEGYLSTLSSLRQKRGHLISLKELRYVDLAQLSSLEERAAKAFDTTSSACVEFFLKPDALTPLAKRIEELFGRLGAIARSSELMALGEELTRISDGLALVGEVVGGLQVGEPADRAKILEAISEVYARVNRVRAELAARRKELLGRERRGEFAGQFKLLSQSIESALSLTDTPAKCDEQLARMSVLLEELEGRFSEIDELAEPLAAKREELFEAFERKKQVLVDERQRRAQNLFSAAERILEGVSRRSRALDSDDELNAYFASDPMLQKLRQLSSQLLALEDSVRADEIDTRLKTVRQEAQRALRDRKDLFVDGPGVIRLGERRFNVNTQPIELSVVPRGDALSFHLSGTDFHSPIAEAGLEGTQQFWDEPLVSESKEVYRGEYLAASLFLSAEEASDGLTLAALEEARRSDGGLLALVRERASGRLDEGYERGVHDVDAAAILEKLLELRQGAGLLRFTASARALACLYWAELADEASRNALQRQAQSLGRLRKTFESRSELVVLAAELGKKLAEQLTAAGLQYKPQDATSAGHFLVETLALPRLSWVTSGEAVKLRDGLHAQLDRTQERFALEEELRAGARLSDRFRLARAWLEASNRNSPVSAGLYDEAAALLLVSEERLPREVSTARIEAKLTGLAGMHARIQSGAMDLRLDEVLSRLSEFRSRRVPAYQAYRARLRKLLDEERTRLRLEELRPKVLSSFVRNRLIDEVYLPLIGANLAKQLGEAGENKRSDRMGLLLLVSPPGYGKTTLMEYVASRLGLVFVKVNGPALGHEVRSLDPADAPNATARQEVERINLSFELGNNVMLYLDDVQHTHPELLQKFISLCDAQRKIEGVWQGRTQTYDLKGKKFCVVMAANPYTEAGAAFRIPDMLANRADTYNLGEVLAGKEELFALSYLENSITSNGALAALSTRSPKDLHALIRMAKGEQLQSSELEHGYSAVELQEMVEVLKRLFFVQRTLLKVNKQYILSASQDERFRSEPAFKLQGSYRNMNKLAEKVVSALTDEELERLLDDHYTAEAQTLTTSAEHNLLKLAELRGRLSKEQNERWEEIKRGFKRVQVQGGKEDDPVVRVTGAIAGLGEELEGIRRAAGKLLEVDTSPKLELGPVVQAIGAAAERMAKAPRAEQEAAAVVAKLEALRQSVSELARAPGPNAELSKLADSLKALADRPVPASAPPGLARRGASAELTSQLQLVQEALLPLAGAAKRTLQEGGEGQLKAIEVWQRVNEALELLQAASGRTRAPKGR